MIQSHKISFAAVFVIVYVVIVGMSLPGAAMASIAGSFLFGITFGTVLNVGAPTLGATALYLVVRWGMGDVFVRRLYRLKGLSKKFLSLLKK